VRKCEKEGKAFAKDSKLCAKVRKGKEKKLKIANNFKSDCRKEFEVFK